MKLRNTTTDFSDHFLRRMVAWCCKQLDFPARGVKAAWFRTRGKSGAWSGRAYTYAGRIVVSLGEHLESDCRVYRAVQVTAHEVAHLMLAAVNNKSRKSTRYGTVSPGGSERVTIWHEQLVLKAFEKDRAALETEWGTEPKMQKAKEKPSAVERRAAKATADLARWQKRLKLAQGKVRKLTKRVRYYERKQAAKSGSGEGE